jgi:hypothetical protein
MRQDILQEATIENFGSEEKTQSEILQNLLYFVANAKDSDKLIETAKEKLSSEIPEEQKHLEIITKFQNILNVFRKNFEALGFFEDRNSDEIANDLQSSYQRVVAKSSYPKPESQLELVSYRSYLTPREGFDYRDRKFFDSLDRDSQSILMGCAIIICAVDAINKTMPCSNPEIESQALTREEPQIHHEILKPLLEYSQEKKGFNRDKKFDSKILKFNSSYSKENIGIICPIFNCFTSVGMGLSALSRDANKFGYIGALIFFSFMPDLTNLVGAVSKNKNFQISPAKFLRNEAIILASTGLLYSVYNQILKRENLEDRKIESLINGYFTTKALSIPLNLLLLPRSNTIRSIYEKFDKKISDFSEEKYLGVEKYLSSLVSVLNIQSLVKKPSMEIKQPTLEQVEIFSKIVKELVKDKELSPIPMPSQASLGELSSRGRSLD